MNQYLSKITKLLSYVKILYSLHNNDPFLFGSQERLFNASIPSLGLRNVIYINETHTR